MSTFPRLSVAEALLELKALNPHENEAASWQQDLFLREEGNRGGGLLAGWLVAEPPTATPEDKKCGGEVDRKCHFNGSHHGREQGSAASNLDSAEHDRQAENGVSSAPSPTPADSHHQELCQRQLRSISSQKHEPALRAAGAVAVASAAQTSFVRSVGEMALHGGSHSRYHRGYKTSRNVARGDVISVERPRAAVQTSNALPWVIACPGCLRHVGTLDLQLAIASGRWDRAQALDFQLSPPSTVCRRAQDPLNIKESIGARNETVDNCRDPPSASRRVGVGSRVVEKSDEGEGGGEAGREGALAQPGNGLPTVPGLSDCFVEAPVVCRMGCGAIYCGDVCRTSCWWSGHSILCLGQVEDEDHPLVKHKIHALAHSKVEAPLLMAAQLIVQAILSVARASRSSPPPPTSTTTTTTTTAPSSSSSSTSPSAGCSRGVQGEAAAVEAILDELPRGRFRPGCGNSRSVDETVGSESWTLLVEALSSRGTFYDHDVCGGGMCEARVQDGAAMEEDGAEVGGRGSREARGGVVTMVTIDPKEFPLLLSRQVHAAVVDGLAANLLHVEVQSPLVDYCEALVTRDSKTQLQALQILEPAFAAMEEEDDDGDGDGDEAEDEDKSKDSNEDEDENENGDEDRDKDNDDDRDEDGDEDDPKDDAEDAENTEYSGLTSLPCRPTKPLEADSEVNAVGTITTAGATALGDGKRPRPSLEANRSDARRAWRCLQAARVAARLVPPLSVRALLPAAASLRHSGAPAARVPAGNPRSYNSGFISGSGGGGCSSVEGVKRAGTAGWPLTVATVAVRDLPANVSVTAFWFEDDADYSDDEEEIGVGDEGREVGEGVRAREPVLEDYIPFGGGGGVTMGDYIHDNKGSSGDGGGAPIVRSSLDCEQLLDAAEHAVGEDRFDDAFGLLQQAAALDPENGDVLYRAGVCAINQGAWSRALRLWRNGLALSPNHAQLCVEAEKYDSLAFWLEQRPSNSDHVSKTLDICSDAGVAETSRLLCDHTPFGPPLPAQPPPQPASALASNVVCNKTLRTAEKTGSSCSSSDNLDIMFMGRGEWVCETRRPPLSIAECAAVIAEAEAKAAAAAATAAGTTISATGANNAAVGGWGTTRHYSVPTTDMAVRDLPQTLAWFNAAMHSRIGPLVAAAAALGDGDLLPSRSSSPPLPPTPTPADDDAVAAANSAATADWEGEAARVKNRHYQHKHEHAPSTHKRTASAASEATSERAHDVAQFVRRLRVHDAFVVRYDSAAQRSLPLHTDQGELSLTISLNSAQEYEGGGTWFEGLGRAVRPVEAGHIVVFPGGDTVHGGREITHGVRYILAVFLYEHHVEEEGAENGNET